MRLDHYLYQTCQLFYEHFNDTSRKVHDCHIPGSDFNMSFNAPLVIESISSFRKYYVKLFYFNWVTK